MMTSHVADELDELIVAAAVLVERIESAAASSSAAAETAAVVASPTRPKKTRSRKQATKRLDREADDQLAHVTLTKAEWADLVNGLGTGAEPLARACRDAIATACQRQSGRITIWHRTDGFGRLLAAILDRGSAAARRVGADVSAQVFRNSKKGR